MGYKVLVVDDSTTLRSLLSKILTVAGLEPIVARHGAEALKVLDAHPDCTIILSDYHMPICDGLTLMRKIKESGTHAEIPIVFLSTERDEAVLSEAKRLGAKAWMSKPAKGRDIVNMVNRYRNYF